MFPDKKENQYDFLKQRMWQSALVLLSRSNSLEKERCSCDEHVE